MELEEFIEKELELEKKYMGQHPDLDDNRLFPRDWYFIDDLELKNKILSDAIEKRVTLYDSELMLRVHDKMLNQRISTNIGKAANNLINKHK